LACLVSNPAPDSVTRLLHAARAGDRESLDQVFTLVYQELRRLAATVRHGHGGETLAATALVHEAFLKLVPSADLAWHDRTHFFRVAARAMRQVLADAAAQRATAKRGGGLVHLTLDDAVVGGPELSVDELLDLDRALHELSELNPRQATVVECRFFAGLSLEETAVAVGSSVPSVSRDWRFARAWLSHRLRAG
jgi:RNA polymerase sigma factor (TIGR02999 family)